MKFEYRDIPAGAARASAEEWRAQDGRGRGRGATRSCMQQVPRGRRAHRGRDPARPARARDQERDRARACAARRSRTRACRRCSTRSSSTCRRRSRCRRSRASTRERRAGRRARPRDDEPFAALAFKILDRSVRRPADLLPRLFRRAQLGRHGLRADQGQEGAHRPPAADARQRARGDQGGARRRHRRGRRPEGRRPRATRCATSRRSSCSRRWCSRSR